MHYFRIFYNKFNKLGLIFSLLDEKHIVGKFEKIFENFEMFHQKIAKMHYFSFFQNNLTNNALIFCAFGRKRQFIGIFEKIFENFEKISSKNCEK